MNIKTKDFIAIFLFVFFSALFVFFVMNIMRNDYIQNRKREVRELMEKEAVFAGHAEWIAGTNGEPVFTWKDCK
jgi:hypothetical protein